MTEIRTCSRHGLHGTPMGKNTICPTGVPALPLPDFAQGDLPLSCWPGLRAEPLGILWQARFTTEPA